MVAAAVAALPPPCVAVMSHRLPSSPLRAPRPNTSAIGKWPARGVSVAPGTADSFTGHDAQHTTDVQPQWYAHACAHRTSAVALATWSGAHAMWCTCSVLPSGD